MKRLVELSIILMTSASFPAFSMGGGGSWRLTYGTSAQDNDRRAPVSSNSQVNPSGEGSPSPENRRRTFLSTLNISSLEPEDSDENDEEEIPESFLRTLNISGYNPPSNERNADFLSTLNITGQLNSSENPDFLSFLNITGERPAAPLNPQNVIPVAPNNNEWIDFSSYGNAQYNSYMDERENSNIPPSFGNRNEGYQIPSPRNRSETQQPSAVSCFPNLFDRGVNLNQDVRTLVLNRGRFLPGSPEEMNYLKNLYLMNLEELDNFKTANPIAVYKQYLKDVWHLYQIEVGRNFQELPNLYNSRLAALNIHGMPSLTELTEHQLVDSKNNVFGIFENSNNPNVLSMRTALVNNSIGLYIDVDNLWPALFDIFSHVYNAEMSEFTFDGHLMPPYTGNSLPDDIKSVYERLCKYIGLNVESFILLDALHGKYDNPDPLPSLKDLIELVLLDDGSDDIENDIILLSEGRKKRLRTFLFTALDDDIRSVPLIRTLLRPSALMINPAPAILKDDILRTFPVTSDIAPDTRKQNQRKKDLLVAALYRYFLFNFRVNSALTVVQSSLFPFDMWLKIVADEENNRSQLNYVSHSLNIFNYITNMEPIYYDLSALNSACQDLAGLTEEELILKTRFVFLRAMLLLTSRTEGDQIVGIHVPPEILCTSWSDYLNSYNRRGDDVYFLNDPLYNLLRENLTNYVRNNGYSNLFDTVMLANTDYEDDESIRRRCEFFTERLSGIFSLSTGNILKSIDEHKGIYYCPPIFNFVVTTFEKWGDSLSRLLLDHLVPFSLSRKDMEKLMTFANSTGVMFQSFDHCVNGRAEGINAMFLQMFNEFGAPLLKDLPFDQLARNLAYLVSLESLRFFQFSEPNGHLEAESATRHAAALSFLSSTYGNGGLRLSDNVPGSYGLYQPQDAYTWFGLDRLIYYLQYNHPEFWAELKTVQIPISIFHVDNNNLEYPYISFKDLIGGQEVLCENGHFRYNVSGYKGKAVIYHRVMATAMEPTRFINVLLQNYADSTEFLVQKYLESIGIDPSVKIDQTDREEILKDAFVDVGIFIINNEMDTIFNAPIEDSED